MLLWKGKEWQRGNSLCFDMFGHSNFSALSSVGTAAQLLCMYVTPSEQLSRFPIAQEQRHKNYFLCKHFLIQRNAYYQNRKTSGFSLLEAAPYCSSLLASTQAKRRWSSDHSDCKTKCSSHYYY